MLRSFAALPVKRSESDGPAVQLPSHHNLTVAEQRRRTLTRDVTFMEPENDNLSSGLSLQEYLAILRRRRAIIFQAFVLIAIVGFVVTMLTKPIYQSTSEMLIDNPGMNLGNVDTSNPLSGLMGVVAPPSPETVVEVLQTPQLQAQVMQEVGPAVFSFNPIKDTSVIQIVAEAGDPKVAAAAPNEMMKEYIQQDADQSLSALESSYQFVQQRKAEADKTYAKSEAALQAYRKKNNIIEFDRSRDEQVARVTGMKQDLQSQKISLAVLQAKIAADKQALAQQPAANSYTLPATNPRVAEMQAAIRALEIQRQAITQEGGLNPHGDSPVLLALDAQIALQRNQLAHQPALLNTQTSSPNTIKEGLKSTLTELTASLAPLKTQIAKTQTDLTQAQADEIKLPDQEQQLDTLTRDRDGAAANAAMFSKQLSDLALREQAHRASAHVIQPALIPTSPVRPQKALNILFSCVIGLFVGLCLALLQEFLDDRINTTEDADRVLALPSLGFVPSLTAADAKLLPEMSVATAASESYRVLRTNINFSSVDAPLKTLLIASASPGEGKTTTAVNLAFAMVMDGKKVLLVDTDLRRPSVGAMLGLPSTPGLTDVLAGTAELADVIMEHGEIPGLMAMTAGSTPPNPSELLNSRSFKTLIEKLTAQADLVILDSPPVLAAADAQILASQVDGTLLVIEPGQTKKAAARQALGLLRHARANVLGVAYNKMRLPGHHNAGYYYYQNAPTARLSDGNGKNGKATKALAAVASETEEE